MVSEHNGVVSLSSLLIVIFWSYSDITSHDPTTLFKFFITLYPKRTKFWQLISLSLYIQREQIFGSWQIFTFQEYQSSVVNNFSVVRIHLVHFFVQVTTWWWSESSSGLIGTKGLCIGLTDIFVLVGSIWLINLLFRQHLSSLLILLSNPSFKLSFGRVSALGITYYRHCYQLFLHWRLNILIWCNYQLLWCLFIQEKIYLQKYKWVLSILLQIIYLCIITIISCCIFHH